MKILLRLGSDITIKSNKIRARFVGRLIQNLDAGLRAAGLEGQVQREWSRLYVTCEGEGAAQQALGIVARTFGVSSCSPVDRECPAELDAIVRAGVELYAQHVAGRSFAVRARRVGDHAYSSMDIMRALGAALAPYAARVDLRRPEAEVFVEVRENVAYLSSKVVRGPAGLPLGVSGKVVSLFSGGFDSPVASWLMQKRGVETEYLFCNVAGAAYERSVITVAKLLASQWGHGTRARLHILDFQALAQHVREQVRPSYAQVVLKRLFYRAADSVAEATGAAALVTGECIGQVSSQTLQNLCVIEAVATRPMLRPVVGLEKDDIVAYARRIGTYDLCAAVQEYCQLVPEKPVTACPRERADEEEARLDPSLLAAALAGRRTLVLGDVSPSELVTAYLFTSEVPPDAVVVDCRPAEQFDAWHYDGALNLELHELLARYRTLDKGRPYVLYCPVGLQSAIGAEKMQSAGYAAYSFKGGVAALASFERAKRRSPSR